MRISDWSSDVCSSDLAKDQNSILIGDVHNELSVLVGTGAGIGPFNGHRYAGECANRITDRSGDVSGLPAGGRSHLVRAIFASGDYNGVIYYFKTQPLACKADRKSTRLNSSH